jgi:hypothetical protein
MSPSRSTRLTSRRTVLAGLLAAPAAPAAASPCRPVKVLFVCPMGTVKSAIAREQFRRMANRRGLEAAQAPGMAGARVWDIPSWTKDYAGARAALLPKVDALLDEIARRPC